MNSFGNVTKLSILCLLILPLFTPAFAEEIEPLNPSVTIEDIEIPYDDFNTISRDANIIPFENTHEVIFQVMIMNDLLYGNPNGNAIFRFYDADSTDKFVEIGMGSKPDEKYWVAVQLPDTGYAVMHNSLERGWVPGLKTTMEYTQKNGLTINNGLRIVVSNLDIENFRLGSFSVHGMESSTDPPATTSGSVAMKITSGNPHENPFHIFPFVLAAGVVIIIIILISTKKRS